MAIEMELSVHIDDDVISELSCLFHIPAEWAGQRQGGHREPADRRYATYADWRHIAQKGRNIYKNLTFEL